MRRRRGPSPHLRRAATPFRILLVAGQNFIEHDGFLWASHIAFTSLLAFFPFLIFLTSLASFFGQLGVGETFVTLLFANLPAEVADALRPAVLQVLGERRGGLLTLSILGTLWVASSGVEALRGALNSAYHAVPTRPFWQLRLVDLLIVLIVAVALIVAMLTVVLGPVLWRFVAPLLGFAEVWRWVVTFARYALGALSIFGIFLALYRWLPNTRLEIGDVVPGAVLATVLWLALATLFSLYLVYFGRYNVTYGSLGGIVVALLFFYFASVVFVFGGEINATVLRRRQAAAEALQERRTVPAARLARGPGERRRR